MTVTISGVLLRHDGQAAQYDDYGAVTEAHDLDVDDVTIGRAFLPVDLDHNCQTIGEIVHVERTRQGDIHAVAIVELDEVADLTDPVYFSAVTRSYNDTPGAVVWHGRRPELLGASLTFSPAALGMSPVNIRRGDVTRHADRYRWPVSWRQSDLLERASRYADVCTRPAGRLQVHDRRPTSAPTPTPVWESPTWSPQRIEYRSASAADVQRANRIIDIVAVPHDTPTVVYERDKTITETIVRGAFASVLERNRRTSVNRDHVGERLVGQAKNLDPHNVVGLVAELHIAKTILGDETLALAADGCLDASVGFMIPAGGATEDNRSRRVHRAELLHIALVADPAYPTANVLDVRALTV